MMATSNLPIYPKTIDGGDVTIVTADASNLKTVYTAPTDGARITSIAVTSDETANARILSFYVNKGSSDRLIGSINIPANSGFNGSAPTIYPLKSTMFGYQTTGMCLGLSCDANGNPYIQLKNGEILKVKSTTTLASGKTITIAVEAASFT